MTKEEAIKSVLKYLVHKQQEQGSWGYADNDDTNEVSWDEIIEWIDQHSCEDCISRQAANKLVDELARAISDEKCHIQRGRNYGRIMQDILELPSVESERNVDLTDNRTPIEEYTDCVRRKDVLWITKETGALETQSRVVKLPSVEPERKIGKWIEYERVEETDQGYLVSNYVCDQCHAWVMNQSNYCPSCGANMEVEE